MAGAVRKIIHIDMDAFYASVEVRDNPALKGLPVAVAGSPQGRGVVLAASYEARAYGVRSAIPTARALRLCPELVIVPPHFAKYQRVSQQIHAIFHRYTDLVEGLSLDEAYLDVTSNRPGLPSATDVARAIKRDIHEETGLTASAGVASTKFLAKVASEERKPDGLFVLRPEQVDAFLAKLAVGKVPGVGKVTQGQLEALGIRTCGDLRQWPLEALVHHFGRRGEYFYHMARGEDDREVEPNRERKSVGIEDTFPEDHAEPEWLLPKLAELASGLERRLAASGQAGRTVTLKIKLANFEVHTRSTTVAASVRRQEDLLAAGRTLLLNSGLLGQRVRLLGLSVSHLTGAGPVPLAAQLELPLPPEDTTAPAPGMH